MRKIKQALSVIHVLFFSDVKKNIAQTIACQKILCATFKRWETISCPQKIAQPSP